MLGTISCLLRKVVGGVTRLDAHIGEGDSRWATLDDKLGTMMNAISANAVSIARLEGALSRMEGDD